VIGWRVRRGWHPIWMAKDAFALTFQGSRDELAEVTSRRVPAALLLLWLTGRCVHLAQAAIDLGAGTDAYGRTPVLAVGLGVACVVESALVGAAMLRRRRLTLGAMLCDAAFGVAGLIVMSAATAGSAAQLGSLNWMLPYTVATAAGLGLLQAGEPGPRSRRRWLLLMVQVPAVAALTVGYLLSAYAAGSITASDAGQLWADAANYPAFFLAGLVLAVGLRRWVTLIGDRNAQAAQQADELSRQTSWAEMTETVLGPVLDVIDQLALVEDTVPQPMRAEADRLMALIDQVGPGRREHGSLGIASAGVPDGGGPK
jgi:hypothetical protein